MIKSSCTGWWHILLFTWCIKIASFCRVLSGMANFFKKCSKIWSSSSYIGHSALLCNLLILLFNFPLWNVHNKGQWLNCYSMNVFVISLILSVLMYFSSGQQLFENFSFEKDWWGRHRCIVLLTDFEESYMEFSRIHTTGKIILWKYLEINRFWVI